MRTWTLAGPCLLLLLQACGGGSAVPADPPPDPGPEAPQACSAENQRQALRAFMNEEYFWYASLGTPDDGAPGMDGYFHSMLYKPTDRYSFTQSVSAFEQVFVDGRRTGYGYTVVWADDAHTALKVRNVEPLSPVARAGLARGDTILSIEGVEPAGIMQGQLPTVTTAGVPRAFVFRNAAGELRSFIVDSEDFALTPVAAHKVLQATRAGAPVKVGYLAYHQFAAYTRADLRLAFADFAAAGIGELVLDLRYNGGGSVNVSRDLASMIGGARTANRLFAYSRFNDKQVARNTRLGFNSAADPLALPLPGGLARVVVITSRATASASEVLINGLKPHIDVVLVGDTTYGKPYGFIPRTECGTVYNAVQFQLLNEQGFSDYAGGFVPDCPVPDDLERQLGDPSERRLQAALDYVASGRCAQPPMAAQPVRRGGAPEVSGETVPAQMFLD